MSPSYGTPSKSKHILVVEDHPGVRKMIADLLGMRYTIRTAENGSEAMAKLMGTNYDLVVTDGDMPILGGPDLVREMKAVGIVTPIILFSGNPDVDVDELGVRLGVAGVLRKPPQPGELQALVNRVLFPPT